MIDKYRWYVVALAIIVGASLVLLGDVTGEQWVSLVGALLGGGGAGAAIPTGKNP